MAVAQLDRALGCGPGGCGFESHRSPYLYCFCMLETTGDIFKVIGQIDAICITTNGVIKKNGHGVCGAGIALAARNRWPDFEKSLGAHLAKNGNVPGIICCESGTNIVSFPTKDHWRHSSDIELIKSSCRGLNQLADAMQWQKIALPRPGCMNGYLMWEVVRKHIFPLLDNKFIVYTQQ